MGKSSAELTTSPATLPTRAETDMTMPATHMTQAATSSQRGMDGVARVRRMPDAV